MGLYRKLSDKACVNILKEIAKVKEGTPDEKAAKDLFTTYCALNGRPETL